jgi:GTP-binding protein
MFPFSEVAIKVVLRARGEGGVWRQDETTEEMAALPEVEDEISPIVRKRGRQRPADDQPAGEERPPKKRKKKPGADTWDF